MTAIAGLHTSFSEVMAGPCDLRGNGERRACRLELDVDVPEVLGPRADVRAGSRGRVVISGLADDRHATGDLHIAPLTRRRIRYRLDFTALDGRRLHLDGWKSISYRRPVRSMTTLPVTVADESGAVVAEAALRFHISRDLVAVLRSLRLSRPADAKTSPIGDDAARDLRPRWNGARGRFEVWYTTLTDGATGTGFWVHHELVAPNDGGPAELGGWAVIFPPGEPPHLARFGPGDWHPPAADRVLETSDVAMSPYELAGTAGRIGWDLHADLGGGDVLEGVAAVPATPVLRHSPPLPLLRLRVDGRDLPAGDTLLAAFRLRAEIGLPTWRVWGRVGDHRIRIKVTQDDAATVAVGHTDPDGRETTVRNSERADVHIRLDRRLGGVWRPYREWRLNGTGHAEVGERG